MISHENRPGLNDPQLILPDCYDGNLIIHAAWNLNRSERQEKIFYDKDIQVALEPRKLEATNLVYQLGRSATFQIFTHGTMMLDSERGMLRIEIINDQVMVSGGTLNPTRMPRIR